MPHPPFPSSTDILMPTPVAPAPTSSQSSPVVTERGIASTTAAGGAQSGSSSGESSSTSLIEDETQPAAKGLDKGVFKSLGNWSIKEFEGDAMDPFEIASLQAINDMEELQSVLQPTSAPPPLVGATAATITAASAAASSTVVQGASSSSPAMVVSSQSQVPIAIPHHHSSAATAAVQSSPSGGPHPLQTSPGMVRGGVVSSTVEVGVAGGAPLSSSPLTQSHFNNSAHEVVGNVPAASSPNPFSVASSSTNPFYPNPSPTVSSVAVSGTNPFQSSEPVQNNVHFVMPVSGSTPNLQHHHQQQQQQQQQAAQEPQRGQSEPGIGTLVDLGDPGGANHPVPAPRNSPKVQVLKFSGCLSNLFVHAREFELKRWEIFVHVEMF